MKISLATNEVEILKCWNVMKVLRPHLKEGEFVSMVIEMISEGYHLAYIEEDGIAVSAVGYRFQQFLFNGRHCYIDDLATIPGRMGKGYAGKLIDYVVEVCKHKGLKSITLDSGFNRIDAHRFYLQKRFEIASLHFLKKI
ncbi:MAG: family N-acetyltransferase [Ferruginibacter sp.]|nr:family N-acetyltransferase [Ferruginibacter sp.]